MANRQEDIDDIENPMNTGVVDLSSFLHEMMVENRRRDQMIQKMFEKMSEQSRRSTPTDTIRQSSSNSNTTSVSPPAIGVIQANVLVTDVLPKQDRNLKYFQQAWIENKRVHAYIDLESQCSMITKYAVDSMGLSYEGLYVPIIIKGFGNRKTCPLGKLTARVKVDQAESQTELIVIPNDSQQIVTDVLPNDKYRIKDLPETQRTQKFYKGVTAVGSMRRYCTQGNIDSEEEEREEKGSKEEQSEGEHTADEYQEMKQETEEQANTDPDRRVGLNTKENDDEERRRHELFMDNYYNSVELSEKLLNLKTHTNGTLRANRRGNLKQLVKRKLKKEKISGYSKDMFTFLNGKTRGMYQ
nr:unnamed protein product [Callosobruchus analis]